jgi:hypothetical protein
VLREVEPPLGLYTRVLARLALARRTAARLHALLLGVVALLSCIALVPAVTYAAREFYASGFYDYASLLISDRSFVFSSWQEFSFSLLESLPSIALLLLGTIAVVLVWSLRRTFLSARVAFMSLPKNA